MESPSALLDLRATTLLLAVAFALAACGVVTPASGPPTYGNGRSHGNA